MDEPVRARGADLFDGQAVGSVDVALRTVGEDVRGLLVVPGERGSRAAGALRGKETITVVSVACRATRWV